MIEQDFLHRAVHRVLTVVAWSAIISSIVLLSIVGYWLMSSYKVLEVDQPLQVLNDNRLVPIGERLHLQYKYVKYMSLESTVYPSIQCESGNLVTLTPFTGNIPVGKSVFISDRFVLPPKFTVGDKCKFLHTQAYQVNPIRIVTYTFTSEFFVIGAPK